MCDTPDPPRPRCYCKEVCKCCCIRYAEPDPVEACETFDIVPNTAYNVHAALQSAACLDRWGVVAPPALFTSNDPVQVTAENAADSALRFVRVDGMTDPITNMDLVNIFHVNSGEQIGWYDDPTTGITQFAWASSLAAPDPEQLQFVLASAVPMTSTWGDPEGRCVQVYIFPNQIVFVNTPVLPFVLLADTQPPFQRGNVTTATYGELNTATRDNPDTFNAGAFAAFAWFVTLVS